MTGSLAQDYNPTLTLILSNPQIYPNLYYFTNANPITPTIPHPTYRTGPL